MSVLPSVCVLIITLLLATLLVGLHFEQPVRWCRSLFRLMTPSSPFEAQSVIGGNIPP